MLSDDTMQSSRSQTRLQLCTDVFGRTAGADGCILAVALVKTTHETNAAASYEVYDSQTGLFYMRSTGKWIATYII